MNISINKFIDFKGLFDALIDEQTEDLKEYRYESDTYRKILYFINEDYHKSDILIEDCELLENTITFVFLFDHDNANESDNQSDTDLYIIEFDRILNEFISFTFN
jgi:hypothetical protein